MMGFHGLEHPDKTPIHAGKTSSNLPTAERLFTSNRPGSPGTTNRANKFSEICSGTTN
jgi:hypothetical protein